MKNYYFKEEYVNIEDCKKMIDYHDSLDWCNIKKWMQEIFPFKNFISWEIKNWLKNFIWFFLNYYFIKFHFNKDKNYFVHWKNWMIFQLKEKEKNKIYLKFYNWNDFNVFITLNKKDLRNNIINIDKIISIKPWFWSKALIELNSYYNINKIKVESSGSWLWFWIKMKERLKWTIDINITNSK